MGFASIWIVVATILAKFDISPAKDEEGKDILPKQEFSTGVSRYAIKLFGGYRYVIVIANVCFLLVIQRHFPAPSRQGTACEG